MGLFEDLLKEDREKSPELDKICRENERLEAELFELMVLGPHRRMIEVVNQIQNLRSQAVLELSSNLD